MKERVITTSAQDTRTKHELATALREVLPKVKAVNLALYNELSHLLSEFDKNQTKVLKSTLAETLANVEALDLTVKPAKKQAKQPVEAKLKKPAKKVEEPVEEPEEEPEEEQEEEKPAPKKAKTKKAEPKVEKPAVKTAKPATNVGIDNSPRAKIFPPEIDHPELGKLIAVPDKYHKYSDLLADLESDKTIYFASYWTKRLLKEFSYAVWKGIDPKILSKGFPFDLDILMAVVPCETMERVFAMSRITEAMFQFEGDDLMPVEDKDGDEVFNVRVSAGMEFEVYVPADEVNEK